MKAAILLDHDWLRQEAPTLQRLAIGLVGEQVSTIQLCPDYWAVEASETDLPVTGRKLPYIVSRFEWLTNRRIAKLASTLEDEEINIVHALDATNQQAAARLAQQLNAALLVEVWSADQAAAAANLAPPVPAAATPDTPPPSVIYAAATEPLAERCRAALPKNIPVTTLKPGVYRIDQADHAPPLSNAAHAVACVIVGDGLYDLHYRALIEALAQTAAKYPQAMFFFYNTGPETHKLWQAVEQAALSSRSSFVPYETSSRQLILEADLIIQPQPLGRVRSLLLDAMATGRAPLAADDRLLDYLIPGTTAQIIEQPEPNAWIRHIAAIFDHPQQWIELGQSARNHVHQHHTASGYVGRIIELYNQLADPKPIAFTPKPG